MYLLPRHHLIFGFASCAILALPLAAADSCDRAKDLHITNTRILAATSVRPSTEWLVPGLTGRQTPVTKPFCRVEGVIDKEIGFEIWLPPADRWNGKYLGTGQGGNAGIENYRDMARGVDRGYASASTDTGHKIADEHWVLGDPQRLVNLGYRSNHLLQETAKNIIAAFYGKAPKFSYFIGCSGGGRLGMKEVQQFPDDYDGVITGTPAPVPSIMTTRILQQGVDMLKNPSVHVTQADWQLVAHAGIKDCDDSDGVRDGVAEDPRRCHIDWESIRCKLGNKTGCLTNEQIQLAQSIYAPIRDDSDRQLDPALMPGSAAVIQPVTRGGMIGEMVYRDPNWDPLTLRFADAWHGLQKAFPDFDIAVTDLSPFQKHGGKIIGYQGWLDPTVLASNTVRGYEAVESTMGGPAKTQDFYRLFMVPGMAHCGGGPGANEFGGSGADAPIVDANHDLLSALEAWVEKGAPPERIIASRVEQQRVVRTHPLCAYPKQAKYSGSGNPNDAANFTCVAPTPDALGGAH
jgi:feruloyl esterase